MTKPASTPDNAKENENSDISEQKFNDLVYSIETKTFTKFIRLFVRHSIFPDNIAHNDPLPKFNFDLISAEIKKRLPEFKKEELENARIWLRDPLRKLDQLAEDENKYLLTSSADITKVQTEERIKEVTGNLTEIDAYKAKLEDLIRAIEKAQGKPEPATGAAEAVRTDTKTDFKQLHLFDQDHHADI